jgi:hypothetical protein
MLADPDLIWKSTVAHLAVKCGSAEAGAIEDGPHSQDSFGLWHSDIPSLQSIFCIPAMKSIMTDLP